jgi:hypothetical protein
MHPRVVLPLIAIAGLAACSGKTDVTPDNGATANLAAMNEQQRAQVEHRAPDPATVWSQRWAAMFNDPAKLITAINEMGYKVGGYAPATGGTGYTATSAEVTLPAGQATPPATVKTSAALTGDTADHVQTITFTFDTHVAGDPNSDEVHDILGYPRQIINGVLQRFQVHPGDPITQGLTQFTPATWSEHGVTMTLQATPATGDRTADHHIVVTVSQSGGATTN